MQKCANLVELENMLQNEYLLAKIGFETAENELSKIWAMGVVLVTKNVK